MQIVVSMMEGVGLGNKRTEAESKLWQMPSLPMTEYISLCVRYLMRESVMSPVFQMYEVPPIAMIRMLSPKQTVLSAMMEIIGRRLTLTKVESVIKHPVLLSVTKR